MTPPSAPKADSVDVGGPDDLGAGPDGLGLHPHPESGPAILDRVIRLAEALRASGVDVSIGELLDAVAALTAIPLDNREALQAGLRATLVKSAIGLDRFDRLFSIYFSPTPVGYVPDGEGSSAGAPPPAPGALAEALRAGDAEQLRALAAQAVDLHAGMDSVEGSERYFLHRVMRAIDLSRMLAAAMQRARREEDLSDLELALLRSELSAQLEEFRRQLAAEIARRLAERASSGVGSPGDVDVDLGVIAADPTERSLIELSKLELSELRRIVQPLARQLAARIGRRRRLRSTGRLDVRRTVRRSLSSGGVPIEVVQRRRHPHKPDIVLLCDVSGSVAEFAQFTFTLVNAVHAELQRVRSFAFVDGIGEVTDLFATALFEIPIGRFTERKGVIGIDGHSDYGRVFSRFAEQHLAEAVGPRTTVLITGDARSNYRDPEVTALAAIAGRARRVYWLHPEPEELWGTKDSVIDDYRPHCDGVFPVQTLAQLASVIADLV